MATWSTLHIFGYGETQLIGTDSNKKVPTSALTKVQAVVDNVYSFKPEGNTATEVYHAINIFNDLFAINLFGFNWLVIYVNHLVDNFYRVARQTNNSLDIVKTCIFWIFENNYVTSFR